MRANGVNTQGGTDSRAQRQKGWAGCLDSIALASSNAHASPPTSAPWKFTIDFPPLRKFLSLARNPDIYGNIPGMSAYKFSLPLAAIKAVTTSQKKMKPIPNKREGKNGSFEKRKENIQKRKMDFFDHLISFLYFERYIVQHILAFALIAPVGY